MILKICIKCKIEKDINEFVKRDQNKYKNICKYCRNLKEKENRIKLKNLRPKKDPNIKYCYNCKKTKNILEFSKNRAKLDGLTTECKECIREINKKQRIKHKERNRKRINKKNKTDINFKLVNNLRKRLAIAIKNNQKAGSAIKDLGCSIDELKKYLELKFYNHPSTNEQMNWNNYGKNGWHIDHIVPLSSFNLFDREELIIALNYINLQPLWAEDNLSKGNRLDWKKQENK